jgi:phosphonate transport system substrate-binding protein
VPTAVSAGEKDPVVYFGVIPRYNPMVMYRNYQPIMDYLTEKTPYHFVLKLPKSYTEAVELLKTGQVQIESLGDVTFFEANRAFGAIPVVKPLNQYGNPDYRSIIIVREESPITTIAALRGKRFAFGNAHSTSGNLIPRSYLFANGITLFDFAAYENLESHDAVAKAVLKGKVDAGAVKDVVAYRYQEHGLRFLASSPLIPSVPIVVRPGTDPKLVKAVREALLAINPRDPAMRQRMKDWDPEFRHGFVPAEFSDYAEIFRLMDAIPGGCGNRCH